MNGKLIVIEGIPGSGKTTLHEGLVREFSKRDISLISTAEPTKEATRLNNIGITIRKIIEGKPLSDSDIEKVRASARALCIGDEDETLIRQRKMFQLRFSSTVGKIVKRGKLTELDRQLLFIADRYFHLTETVAPALQNGTFVLMDRYELSTAVHYWMKTSLESDFLARWQYPLLGPAYIQPGYVFILKVSPETAFERQKTSGKEIDMYEKRVAQMELLAKGYRHLIDRFRRVRHSDPRYRYPFIVLDAEKSPEEVLRDAVRHISFPASQEA